MVNDKSNEHTSGIDTHSYKGWLNSDSFLKRAFAIYGYMMVAGLIIMIPLYIIMFLVFIIIFILSAAAY